MSPPQTAHCIDSPHRNIKPRNLPSGSRVASKSVATPQGMIICPWLRLNKMCL